MSLRIAYIKFWRKHLPNLSYVFSTGDIEKLLVSNACKYKCHKNQTLYHLLSAILNNLIQKCLLSFHNKTKMKNLHRSIFQSILEVFLSFLLKNNIVQELNFNFKYLIVFKYNWIYAVQEEHLRGPGLPWKLSVP